jgi:hypothetical protein
MPAWTPTVHSDSKTILTHAKPPGSPRRRRRRTHPHSLPVLPHEAPHRFAIPFGTGPVPQGLWVKEEDGSYTYHQDWTAKDAVEAGYKEYYEVGRVGYYLTLEEARQAIPDGAHGVYYVDDYNDEFQDFFVCAADGNDPEPFKEAHAPEPIQ